MQADQTVLSLRPGGGTRGRVSVSRFDSSTAPGSDLPLQLRSFLPSPTLLTMLLDQKALRRKLEWSCAVRRFRSSSQQQLNEHLQGRKHKNKESEMPRAQKGPKNYRIGLSSKKATKHKSAAESFAFSETQVGSLRKDHLPSSQICLNSHSWKENESKLDPNIRMDMKKRRRSKKRARRLHILELNCGAGLSMIPAMIKAPQQW